MAAAFLRCDETPQWAQLRAHHAARGCRLDLRSAFAEDAQRFAHFSQQAPLVFADLSKNLWSRETETLLLDMARACGLEQRRAAMLAGQRINSTEDRPALHTLLRRPAGLHLPGDEPWLAQALQEVHATLQAMLDCAEALRNDPAITDVVNIGIGGSDLGPQMAVLALETFRVPGKRFHFVSNIDGHELQRVLCAVRPESTVFLVASKTFTTPETMTNARSALDWFVAQGGQDVAQHFVALTSNVAAARTWGITTTFGFWDLVGGRYSLWSAIGLPIAIAIGAEGFRALLAGAHAMDEHFRTAPLAANLPVRLALLDVWYRNFLGFTSRCIAPYHAGLRRLAAHWQQLEMESNGKRVDQAGRALPFATSPVLWGEPGSNGQHAFFQMLHQGTDVIPVDFILIRRPTYPTEPALSPALRQMLDRQHDTLLANGVAQAQALMWGKTSENARSEPRPPTACASMPADELARQRTFPGNRPSLTLLLDELSPRSLGALIALYEHRTFVTGALWGINSFDQWGVELGKVLCKDILARMQSGQTAGLDGATAAMLTRLR